MMTQPVSPEDALKAEVGRIMRAICDEQRRGESEGFSLAYGQVQRGIEKALTRTDPPKTVLDEEVAAVLEDIAAHAKMRIADGDEMGARVWRIALEDIERDARALIARLKDCGTD